MKLKLALMGGLKCDVIYSIAGKQQPGTKLSCSKTFTSWYIGTSKAPNCTHVLSPMSTMAKGFG